MSNEQLPLFALDSADVVTHPPQVEIATAPDEASTPTDGAPDADAEARRFAVDPRNNVVLEASAGTGKTSVLVARYVNLLKAGVEPANILAITFTRKAAAEMRERIVRELRDAAAKSEFDKARWLALRDRLGEIAISTIDAFCLSLLREFPLEADLDPGFEMADETEIPRFVEESLDRAMRIFVKLAREEPDVALVLAQLGAARTREGFAVLLERRLVAWDALNRFLAHGPSDLTSTTVCRRAAITLQDVIRTAPGGIAGFLADGPIHHPRYELFVREVNALHELERAPDATIRGRLDRIGAHFLTQDGKARAGGTLPPYRADHYPSPEAAKRHRAAVFQIAPHIERALFAFNRDLNVVLARGVRKMFGIALAQYRRALEERSVLDFSDVLERALDLLRRMDEFSQSRFRLEGRYHHVLVDEFQDTSRAQWELVSLLIQSWREGMGIAANPSIFIVGDRKQSIYRFRDAELAVMQEAGRRIELLRPGSSPRRSIARSFRAVPELLAFVNDVFSEVAAPPVRADDFTYTAADRFPIPVGGSEGQSRPLVSSLGISVGDDATACATAVAVEIARLLREDTVRDRQTGVARQARPGDVAILFRSRSSHREFERELSRLGVPTYVYKGLGFFDADEIKDVTALIRYLADPASDLRAAAFLRSRIVRLSDVGLARLAPRLAAALSDSSSPGLAGLDDEDRQVLTHVRKHVGRWLARVDRVPPADLIEELLRESAYAYELRGARRQQAWENVKKMRGLVRRIQNRGYATLTRIADHIDALTAGDESNAVLEAVDAVNLMTVHASKGLEFPIVFVVNLAKGATGPPKPVRVIVDGDAMPSVSIGPFVSEMEEVDRDREKHETRRLLYVALTRARDRLYLSSVLKDGALVPGRGSLAEVMPESLRGLFPLAATAFPEMATVAWTGQSGHTFEWRLCRAPAAGSDGESVPAAERPKRDLSQRSSGNSTRTAGPRTVSATEWVDSHAEGMASTNGAGSDLVVGRLVHRMLAGVQGEIAPDALARALLTADERATVDDVDGLIARAVSASAALRANPEVAALLGAGTLLREVPFSMVMEDAPVRTIVRGAIDLLVVPDDGPVVVVEFKTGRGRPSHERQLALYVKAARALYSGRAVEGRLIYP